MKRWILLAIAAAVVVSGPSAGGRDVARLLPVELLYIYRSGDQILVETDTGDLGTGGDLTAALEDLKASASAEIFLETADYLVVTEQTKDLIPQLWNILRPATEVCLGIRANAKAAEFLTAHRPGVTLNDMRAGVTELPVLIQTEGRYHLVGTEDF